MARQPRFTRRSESIPTPQLSALNWEVNVKNVYYGQVNGTDGTSDYQALTRSNDNGLLSIMKSDYNPMLNSEFMDMAEALAEITGFKLLGYSQFMGGRKVLGYLQNNKEDHYIGSNKIQDYLTIGNSHDGSSSFFIGTSTMLLRCSNQFSRIHQISRVRHSSNMQKRLEELKDYVSLFFQEREEMYTRFNRFGEVIVDEKMREQLIDFLLEVKDRKEVSTRKANQMSDLRKSLIEETSAVGNTAWGLFNGVTHYTTHVKNEKNPTFGTLFGSNAVMNNKAYNKLSELIVVEK